jgi:TonB-dependent starch-binding outer membrane protein SusC
VMGYTTIKKKDVTGSVSSLTPEQVTRMQNNNIVSALVGVAGVRVTGNDVGDIRIRGNRSVQANNAPLLIVDGVPFYGSLNTIDQNDIASLDILKDASSTALYGSRGANGVIIITTKKGVKDKPRITFDSYTGMGVYYDNNLHNLNASEYIQFKRDANRAVGIWASPEDDYKIFSSVELDKLGQVDNDFYGDYIKQNGFQTNSTISYASGNEHGQQKISLNYLNNNARGNGMGNYDRFILSTANDYQAGKKFSMGLSSRLSYEKNFPGPSGFGDALFRFIPTVDLYEENGKLIAFPIGDSMLKNPYLDLDRSANDGQSTAYEAFLKAYVNYDIVDNLTLKSNISIDQVFTGAGSYIDDRAASHAEALNQASISNGRITRFAWNTMLNYVKTFGDHGVNAYGVFEIQENKSFSAGGSGSDQALAQYKWYNIQALTQNKALSSGFVRSQQLSYVGRAQYSFKDRYILTGTVRYDGASQLAPRDRWDFFPSIGAAWNISDEEFISNIPVLSNLKLRGSYGVTGNNAIDPYATYGAVLSRYTVFSGSGGDKAYPTLEPDQLGVETLRWEKTKMVNVGIDFGFFDQRLTGNVDFYRSNTYDLLNRRKLPYTTGFNNVWDNIGTSRNTGFEVSLNASVVEKGDWTWKAGLSFYHNTEELTELYDPRLDKDIQNGWWLGYPVNGVSFDYMADGIWQLDEANIAALYGRNPGEIKVRDVNGDGAITGDDRRIIGTDRPTLQSSLTSTITYKNFDLMLDVYSEIGAIAYDNWSTGVWAFDMGRFNAPRVDYWTPENPSNTTPQPLAGHSGIDYMSSLGYKSNDFIRLRNITLGYTVNASALSAISKMRVYVSATEPLRYWKFTREGGLSSREVVYNLGFNVSF